MTPTIRPGEMLWIDVSYTSPSSDGLYLIRIGKELLVRRIQLNPFDGSAAFGVACTLFVQWLLKILELN